MMDYQLLANAAFHYTQAGFTQVETPWLVDRSTVLATIPPEALSGIMTVEGRNCLVGSAEQGFLEMDLEPGRYFSVSPCFRAGEIGDFHQETFMKLELHRTDDVSTEALIAMLEGALAFFRSRTETPVRVTQIADDEFDVEINDIEVGSYGRRKAFGRTWLYGTGLALPRFNLAVNVSS